MLSFALFLFLIGTFAVYTFLGLSLESFCIRPPLSLLECSSCGGGKRRGESSSSPAGKSEKKTADHLSTLSFLLLLLLFRFILSLLLNQELLDRQLEGLDLALELRPFVGRHGARDDLFLVFFEGRRKEEEGGGGGGE